jgi:oxygen-independent coproporphyrinogen-3 oxidase
MYSYIHIPFCRQKCLYCKFALTPRWQEAHIRKYLTFLEKEIRAFFVTQSHQKLQSIYFGGGTPSVLSVDQIAHII